MHSQIEDTTNVPVVLEGPTATLIEHLQVGEPTCGFGEWAILYILLLRLCHEIMHVDYVGMQGEFILLFLEIYGPSLLAHPVRILFFDLGLSIWNFSSTALVRSSHQILRIGFDLLVSIHWIYLFYT